MFAYVLHFQHESLMNFDADDIDFWFDRMERIEEWVRKKSQ